MRLTFATDATAISGACAAAPGAPIELVCDGHLIGAAPLAGQESFRFEGLPSGLKRVQLLAAPVWALPPTGLSTWRGH